MPVREPLPDNLVEMMSARLRTSGSNAKLRPCQAQALFELEKHCALFAPIRVGGGKTLISLLAPVVLGARRPMLICPAALVEKTKRDRLEASPDWQVASNLRVVSFEMLGRVQSAKILDFYLPDFIIIDEGHRAKNKRAGVTRRIARYMKAHPDTIVAIMSGTILGRSLKDFAHLIEWTHKDRSPLPLVEANLLEWCDAIDEKVNVFNRVEPGVLGSSIEEARAWFCERLNSTPGVVSSLNEDIGCSLNIQFLEYDVAPATEANFERLRTTWETPDGWALSEAVEVWRVARELALGFHSIWSPRPPDEWLGARRAWAKYVRDTLSHSRTLDTELQVTQAVRSGLRDPLGAKLLEHWEQMRPTFKVNGKDVWHDDSALKLCEKWGKETGIIWVEQVFFGKELARRTGHPYFGPGGLDDKGRSIMDAKGTIIASVAANGTGRNLQKWDRNLITSMPCNAQQLEQLLGRTHRSGQESDEVTFDVLWGCWEHANGLNKAYGEAQMIAETIGHEQKLLIATMDPSPIGKGFRWKSNS